MNVEYKGEFLHVFLSEEELNQLNNGEQWYLFDEFGLVPGSSVRVWPLMAIEPDEQSHHYLGLTREQRLKVEQTSIKGGVDQNGNVDIYLSRNKTEDKSITELRIPKEDFYLDEDGSNAEMTGHLPSSGVIVHFDRPGSR